MRLRTITPILAVSIIVLAGCGNDTDTAQQDSSSAAPSATPTSMTNTGHWTGNANSVKINANTKAKAPTAVSNAWTAAGLKSWNVMAVEVDNRQGSVAADLTGAEFVSDDGSTTEYKMLSDSLEGHNSSAAANDTTLYSSLVDIHNQYSADTYKVPAGAKKTFILGSETKLGDKVTHATVSTAAGEVPLTSAQGDGPVAPEPSAEPSADSGNTSTDEQAPDTEPATEPAMEETPAPEQTYDNPNPDESIDPNVTPPDTPDVERDDGGLTQEQCQAADPNTADSATRQGCWTQYGIRVGG